MIGNGTGDYCGADLDGLDHTDWKPDYPVPREAPEKSVSKLVSPGNQRELLMFRVDMRLALTILGLMLLLNGMLVIGAAFFAPSVSRTLQSYLGKLLYKRTEI
jgi:hypothetical protein